MKIKFRIVKKEFVAKINYIVQYKKFLFWHTVSREVLEHNCCDDGPIISSIPKTFVDYEDAVREIQEIISNYKVNKLTSSSIVFNTEVKL